MGEISPLNRKKKLNIAARPEKYVSAWWLFGAFCCFQRNVTQVGCSPSSMKYVLSI